MPPSPAPSGTARSAEAVNREIRALVARAGGVWPAEEYAVLLAEYAEAVRRDVVEAA